MILKLILRRLDTEEKKLGQSIDYMRHIARVSLRAFFKLAKIVPMAQYRRALPAEPYHLARLVATRDADCGTCVQIEVNLALKSGVAADLLRSAVAGRPEELPEDLANVYRFAEAVVKSTGAEDELREQVRRLHGEEGLVELALAMAACRVFPLVKRTLGYATSCARVKIEV